MLYGIFQGISLFLQIIGYVLLAYCLLSWILPPQHQIMRFLARFVDPLLGLVRPLMFRVFPRMPIDLSALVVFFLLNLAQRAVWWIYRLLL